MTAGAAPAFRQRPLAAAARAAAMFPASSLPRVFA